MAATASDFALHGGEAIYETIENDGNRATQVSFGETSPVASALAVHGHADLVGRATILGNLRTSVGDNVALERSASAATRLTDGNEFVELLAGVALDAVVASSLLTAHGFNTPE